MSFRSFKTAVLLFLVACLALAGWMLFHSLGDVPMVGCGAGSACDNVMGSPWAYVLGGVPVSLPAAVIYLLLIICVLFLEGGISGSVDVDPVRSDGSAKARSGRGAEGDCSLDRVLWPLMLILSGCIIGAALWFAYLQAFVLHTFCKYCSLLHLLGVVVAVLIIFAARRHSLSHHSGLAPESPHCRAGAESADCRGGRIVVPLVAGLVAAAVFAVVQSFTRPEAVYDVGRAESTLPSFGDGEMPAIGPEDSQEELTLLFDFQCIHCRRLHRILPELLEQAGGQYRIRLCPVPLSSACNPYIPASGIDRFAGSCPLTRYALAVWFARPDAYEAFWDYLLGGPDIAGNDVAGVAHPAGEGGNRSTVARDGYATNAGVAHPVGEWDEHAVIDPADAEVRARALLGDDFEAAVGDPRIDAYLRRVEELFGRTSSGGKGGIPRFIAGQRWLVPDADTPAALLNLLRTELGVSTR